MNQAVAIFCYGTSQGVERAWDTRGRGRKPRNSPEEIARRLKGLNRSIGMTHSQFFHGTTVGAGRKILREGLKAKKQTGWGLSGEHEAYLTPSKSNAHRYGGGEFASLKRNFRGGHYAVVEFKIPPAARGQLEMGRDPLSFDTVKHGGVRVSQDVPKEFVKAVHIYHKPNQYRDTIRHVKTLYPE